jgi:hypothetical protein
VLVQLPDATDPRPGTATRYALREREGLRGRLVATHEDHAQADQPGLWPIVLEDVEEDAVQVIAELVEVLGTEGPVRS